MVMNERYHTVLQALKGHHIRLSHQRMKVVAYLCENMNHPTADQIYVALHREEPTLSKTTIYNTLHVLVEAGLLRELNIEDTEVRYDIITEAHGHFKCESCKAVFNFDINSELLASTQLPGFKVLDKSIYFKGICPKCLLSNK